MALIGLGRENRCRAKIHYGDLKKVKSALESYGVPVNEFPLDDKNRLQKRKWRDWIIGRSVLEELLEHETDDDACRTKSVCNLSLGNSSLPLEPVEPPLSTDVLVEVGSLPEAHPGNAEFRKLLQKYSNVYFEAKTDAQRREALQNITRGVVADTEKGRFLEWHTDARCWVKIQNPGWTRAMISKILLHDYKNQNRTSANQESSNDVKAYFFEQKIPLHSLQERFWNFHPMHNEQTVPCFSRTDIERATTLSTQEHQRHIKRKRDLRSKFFIGYKNEDESLQPSLKRMKVSGAGDEFMGPATTS
jgi:hypothetical protein